MALPCNGQICAGSCYGPCPAGYTCTKGPYGLYRCVKNVRSVWEQWWFWLLFFLIIATFVLVLFLFTKMNTYYSNTPKPVQTTSAPSL